MSTPESTEEQLVKYLADAHAVELQALTQMRRAPGLAGDERLAAAYRQHRAETVEHERSILGRLRAHHAEPSSAKDLGGRAGGWAMLLFARSQPDTTAKLTAHAFSYEKMEQAMYGLLRAAAKAAGDVETAEVAAAIATEEEAMAGRLAARFDLVVETALREVDGGDIDRHLNHYLADAHALEQQGSQLLSLGARLVDDADLEVIFADHLERTHEHAERVLAQLQARGSNASAPKDLALRVGALGVGGFFAVQPDTTVKLSGFAFAFENLEFAVYELLGRLADRAGEGAIAAMAFEIAAQEASTAEHLESTWERVMEARLARVPSGAPAVGR